jgi:hypothetical protein
VILGVSREEACVVEGVSGRAPDVGVVVDTLAGYHDDGVLLEKVLVRECGVVLNLFDVDDCAVVAECLVEHGD